MLDSVLDAFMQLKTFILVSGIGIVLTGIYFLLRCRTFDWNKRNLKEIGFFYNLSVCDTVGVSCCFVKMFLIVSILITLGKVDVIHMIIFGILELCYIIHRRSVKGVMLDFVLCVVSIIVMNIMNMLHHYLYEIVFDMRITIVIVLLGILLCLYSMYDLLHCVKTIVYSRKGSDIEV